MSIGMEGCGPNPRTYSKAEYDALHAEAKALRANIARLTSNPADHRYWEGRYRDAEAELEEARGLLNSIADNTSDDRARDMAVDFITGTPAPEVPDHIAEASKMVEQGERQE